MHGRTRWARLLAATLPCALALLSLADSGSAGQRGGGVPFAVTDTNLSPGVAWQINRPIEIRFNKDVDFNTVNANTLQIREVAGMPSVGEFRLLAPRVVEYQPRCPHRDDMQDAGLRPGGVDYLLRVPGLDIALQTVQSTAGETLVTTFETLFETVNSNAPSQFLYDPVPGAPQPVIRSVGSMAMNATYIELAGDPAQRLYFERAANGTIALEGGAKVPLNLLSNPSEQVALILFFDQPVRPGKRNMSSARLSWQYQDQLGQWRPLATRVQMESNCNPTGAAVRIEPLGVLPPDAALRAVIAADFIDLVGESNATALDAFAPARSELAPSPLADSLEEEFDFGAPSKHSTQMLAPDNGDPTALWGGGELKASTGFQGSGGPGGNFDWQVPAGQVFVFDTTSTILVGGPNFVPTTQYVALNGVIDLRRLRIGAGATLRIQGPNPVVILASGLVEIFGTIDISGVDSLGVVTLNAGNIPEPGAAGVAGGGRGGTGNPLAGQASPQGGPGFGAFGAPGVGGQGGETGWSAANPSTENRRGAGGGGGVLGKNQPAPPGHLGTWDQTFIGLDAEPGFESLLAQGALSGVTPAKGGAIGSSPFVNANPNDDFFGLLRDLSTGQLTKGELPRVWAGAGGGGGGNASFTNGQPYPPLPYDPAGDEKGAGGGGGGGSLSLLTLGDVVFGPAGRIDARGGTGGGGENTLFLDRVGGGSGGGSGGHVVIQTIGTIDLSQSVPGPPPLFVPLIATGSEGGAGKDNAGGASIGPVGSIEKLPHTDACPPGYPFTGPNSCLGHVNGAGGDGSPGIIQLHTLGGLAGGNVILPAGKTLKDLCKPTPVHSTATENLLPSFGARSSARSQWIRIGLGGFDSSATVPPFFKPGTYSFGDVDPVTGKVQTSGTAIVTQPPILGPTQVQSAPQLPSISPDGRTLTFSAASLLGTQNQIYVDNTGLLDHFVLLLQQTGNPSNSARFTVAAAAYDPNLTTLALTISSDEPPLSSFTPGGGVEAALIPTFFNVSTDGARHVLPSTASVRIAFQATGETSSGAPDELHPVPLVPGSDPNALNQAGNNPNFRYLRFLVEFDMDAAGTGLTPGSPTPSVEFLRIPFRY